MGEVEPRYVAPWPGIHEMMVTNLQQKRTAVRAVQAWQGCAIKYMTKEFEKGRCR